MLWYEICLKLSKNDFTIILKKNMVLVDYIGNFFTCGNTFEHMLYNYKNIGDHNTYFPLKRSR